MKKTGSENPVNPVDPVKKFFLREREMNLRMRPRDTKILTTLFLAALMGALALSAGSCRETFTRNDPVLEKPLDQLTDQDLSRMVAVVKTNYGQFKIALHPEWAPASCRVFVKLVKGSFYYGLTFHEVRPGTWIVGGDPLGDGTGGPGFKVEPEKSSGPNLRGAVGLFYPFYPLPQLEVMGSQFYVLIRDQNWMNGKYNVFGQVIDGMATVDRIGAAPVTPLSGRPRPYMPLSPVVIEDIHLEAKKGTGN
jgi:cyclophilin family peptidyl-prolyl cis-trans isomerase